MLSFETVRGEGRRTRPLKQKYSALGWHDFLLVSCTKFSSLFPFEVRPWTGTPLHTYNSPASPQVCQRPPPHRCVAHSILTFYKTANDSLKKDLGK